VCTDSTQNQSCNALQTETDKEEMLQQLQRLASDNNEYEKPNSRQAANNDKEAPTLRH
jgi:hypothetical protein